MFSAGINHAAKNYIAFFVVSLKIDLTNALPAIPYRYAHIDEPMLKHSHKKRDDSLETGAVLLIFSLEPGISRVGVENIHQNSKKWRRL